MELINNINLSNSNESAYQSIYSSQLYGTFFMIYAIFETRPCINGYEISSIKLRLMNYKGLINLGISRARFFTEENKENSHHGILKIEVEAMCPNNNIDFPVAMRRNCQCSIDDYIYVDRSVKKLPAALHNNVFDEEFLYREGFEYKDGQFRIKSNPRKDTAPKNTFDTDVFDTGIIEPKSIFGGTICPRSQNQIIK